MTEERSCTITFVGENGAYTTEPLSPRIARERKKLLDQAGVPCIINYPDTNEKENQ